jgi:hypothetical protein
MLIFKGWTTFIETIFVKNKKYERGGRLKVKLDILFYGDNPWIVAVSQMRFGIVEDHGRTYNFYFIHYFV